MKYSPKYIGMVGSKKKTTAIFESMEKAGILRERINKVSSPIGLDIGAETPAEISVSILSEIISVRRNKKTMVRMAIQL